MKYEMREVVLAITDNAKRMSKLESLGRFERIKKVEGFVVAEAQKRKVKLTPDDMCGVCYAVLSEMGY